jgi:repressor LexA
MLTKKQYQLLMIIRDSLGETGISPSFEEMKDALGLHSKSGVHRLVKALEERGFIRRLPHRARALEILKLPDNAPLPAQPDLPLGDRASNVVSGKFGAGGPFGNVINAAEPSVEIPLHGRIAAGTPIEAIEHPDSMLSVPPHLLGAGAHFALQVSGDSMVDLGIMDGDTAIIKQCQTANNGDVVVALVDEEEATLKTLHRRGHQIALKPANISHSTQILPADRVKIQGKLIALMRQY